MQYIAAIMALLPYIKALLDLFIQTPEEKRDELIAKLGAAFKKAKETGDTSDIENTIHHG